MRVADDIAALEAESLRIVEAISGERTPDAQIDARIAALRERAAAVFPGHPEVFETIYARRFQRLRRRFRPSPALFGGGAAAPAAPPRVSPASASTRA